MKLSELKRWVWYSLILGSDPPRVTLPPDDGDLDDHHHDSLYDRLVSEASSSRPRMRQVVVKNLSDPILVDEIIGLMFALQNPKRTFVPGHHWLPAAMKNADSLRLQRRIIYVYAPAVDEDDVTETGDIQTEIKNGLRLRLIQLILDNDETHSLVKFVYKQIVAQFSRLNQPYNDEHRDAGYLGDNLLDLLKVNLSICRVKYPNSSGNEQETAKITVFITGKNPIHDLALINKRQDDAKQQVNLALTIRAVSTEERPIRLNAHHFEGNDLSPQTVTALYIGDWRKDWTFTVGSAEHDEIRCEMLGKESITIHISDLKKELDQWRIVKRGWEQLPWLEQALPLTIEGVLDKSLLFVLATPSERPRIMLSARVLPFKSDISALLGMNDLRQLHPAQSVVSAIEVRRELLWLIRTEDGAVHCFNRSNFSESWRRDGPLTTGQEFPSIGGYTYRWKAATGETVPAQFCGLLFIDPSSEDKVKHSRLLSQGEGAEFAVNIGLFANVGSPDSALGKDGVVKLKFHQEIDGRPSYVLLPVKGARAPFFAYQPSVRPLGATSSWLIYNPKPHEESSLVPLVGQEIVTFDGNNPMVVDGANNTLICGTSVFQIKTSGTPHMELVSMTEAGTSDAQPTSSQKPDFNPADRATIGIKLRSKGKWQGYKLSDSPITDSLVSVGWGLTNPKANKEKFLKAYHSVSEPNARREAAFYEKYRSRANNIFIIAPDEILRDEPGDAPWGILFPLLRVIQGPTLVETAAIGYGMATLLEALSADEMINFDLDSSMLCQNKEGRLVVVDFDNIYPMLSSPPQEEQLRALERVLDSGKLPAKNALLPPEAHVFSASPPGFDRQLALSKIGDRFNTYMLAVILLQLHNLAQQSSETGGRIVIPEGRLAKLAAEERANVDAARGLDLLLREMVEPDQERRPGIADATTKLASIVKDFARHNDADRDKISKLVPRLFSES